MKSAIACLMLVSVFTLGVVYSNATAETTVEELKSVYDAHCDAEWATLSSDGMSLQVDTNPSNREDYTNYKAYLAVSEINEALGLPDSVYSRMGSTSSMQGVQTAVSGNLTVSWTYHPDNGMEIIYAIE